MPTGSTGELIAMNAEVGAVFDGFEDPIRSELLGLRHLILTTAAETDGVGPILETLKWGQPAYLAHRTKSGTTVRIAPTAHDSEDDFAVFFTCHTELVNTFKSLFGDIFRYEGTRALLFKMGQPLPERELRECVAMALTYNLADR